MESDLIQQKLRELEILAHTSRIPMDFILDGLKRQFYYAALERSKGNACQAAKAVGRHRNSFSYTEKKLGVGIKEIREKSRRA